MRAVIQRVREAAVHVDGELVGRIGPGLLVLLGVARGDGQAQVDWLAAKIPVLRIFDDAQGRMNLSLRDTGGEILVVSQFTLMGDCRKGRRPSWNQAAPPEQARALYEALLAALRGQGLNPARGRFQAMMEVSLVNHGPVTLILDTP